MAGAAPKNPSAMPLRLAFGCLVAGMLACTGAGAADAQAAAEPLASGQDAPPDVATVAADATQPPAGDGFFSQFIDEEDHHVDFSNFLAKGGFIPIPVIITEPAVDGGGGLAAAFFKADPEHPRQVTRHVLGAIRTGNGSKGVGYFQSGYAFDGRLNYRFGVGRGEITLDTYPTFAPDGIEYTSEYDYGVVGSALWRLPDERFSIGPLFDFRKLEVAIEAPDLPDEVADLLSRTLNTGALGLGAHFDSRDNPLTPTRGTNAYVEAKFNRDAFGSDRDFETYDANLFVFNPLTDKLRYGAKVEFEAVRGDFPFFFAPAIDLRGVQAAEYQGMNVVSTEAEVTWQINRRWSLLAFAGYGSADGGDRRTFRDSGDIWAGGVGFRYRLARKLGFDAGADIAYGPGGVVWYLQFGHAWSFGMD